MESNKVKSLANKLLRANKNITIPKMLEVAIQEKLTARDTRSVIGLLCFFGLDCVASTEDYAPFEFTILNDPRVEGAIPYFTPLTRIYEVLMPTIDPHIWNRFDLSRKLYGYNSIQKLEYLGDWHDGWGVPKNYSMHELISITPLDK